MRCSLRIALSCLVCASIAACAPNEEGASPPPPPDETPMLPARYICPQGPYLNCMPIVPPERQTYCSGQYREWITANCANVEIVY